MLVASGGDPLSCYTTVGFVPTLGMLWLPPGRSAYIANGFAQGTGRLEIYPHLLPLHDGQCFRIVRISLGYQSVPDRLYFRFIGAQESVNENEHVGVVLVNILLIDAMVHSVGRRCVQETLGNPELGNNLGMPNNTPEGGYRADNHNDRWVKAKNGQDGKKRYLEQRRKHGLAKRHGEVHLLAGVMA